MATRPHFDINLVCCSFELSVVVTLGDFNGGMMGTLQGGRVKGINTDIFPIISKTLGLFSAVVGKRITLDGLGTVTLTLHNKLKMWVKDKK